MGENALGGGGTESELRPEWEGKTQEKEPDNHVSKGGTRKGGMFAERNPWSLPWF